MTFTELVKKNRSYRGFSPDIKLTHDQLVSLVEITRYCPSSGNIQALRFHISEDAKEIAAILSKLIWGGRLKSVQLPHPGKEPTSFISIYIDTSLNYNEQALDKDVGIAAYAILLRATEMGFGGCLLGCISNSTMHDLVSEPECMKFKLLIALGKPDETIVIEEAGPNFINRNNSFYRDENDIHHVYKRPYSELFI